MTPSHHPTTTFLGLAKFLHWDPYYMFSGRNKNILIWRFLLSEAMFQRKANHHFQGKIYKKIVVCYLTWSSTAFLRYQKEKIPEVPKREDSWGIKRRRDDEQTMSTQKPLFSLMGNFSLIFMQLHLQRYICLQGSSTHQTYIISHYYKTQQRVQWQSKAKTWENHKQYQAL